MRRLAILGLVSGCGPQVLLDTDDTDASDDGAIESSGSASAPGNPGNPGVPSTTAAADSGGPGGVPPPPGDGTTDPTNTGPTEPPPDEPAITLCDGDPYLVDPRKFYLYEECMRGIITFSATAWTVGEMAFDAYAQFYSVEAFSPSTPDEEILEPWSGPYGCGLARYGNSATGGEKVVLWEDAGDVTFVLGPDWVPAMEYGNPVNVLGYTFEDESYVPLYGNPHGLVATGDTTPPFDLPDLGLLPSPFEDVTPSLDGSATVDAEDLVVTWAPDPYTDVPVTISISVSVAGDDDYVLYCTTPDTGELTLPPELVVQLPLPTTAGLHLRRADLGLEPADDGRFILSTLQTSAHGEIMLQ